MGWDEGWGGLGREDGRKEGLGGGLDLIGRWVVSVVLVGDGMVDG